MNLRTFLIPAAVFLAAATLCAQDFAPREVYPYDRVQAFDTVEVRADEEVHHVISAFGDLKVDGVVRSETLVVMGNAFVNGAIRNDVIVLFGNLTLGPQSRIDGSVTVIGGLLERSPTSVIAGDVHHLRASSSPRPSPAFAAWVREGFLYGRPLALSPGMRGPWIFSAIALLISIFLAVVFPRAVQKCGDVLVERPAATLGATILTLLALPIFFALLMVTLIGIPVAVVVLPLALVLSVIFGKTALYALIGRGLSRGHLPLPLAVLAGGLVILALYVVPFVGLLVAVLLSVLGFGCTMAALFAAPRLPAHAPAPAPRAPSTPPPDEYAGDPEMPYEPEPLPESYQQRGGFWIRIAAFLIDVIVVGVLFGIPSAIMIEQATIALFPAYLALYCAVLWRVRGATIGGMVFKLKVVRTDARPMDLSTAIVRSFACFLSAAVAFLGFIWVVVDAEKQAWHDRIAGTVVIRPRMPVSLV